jgi:hypothetical protein
MMQRCPQHFPSDDGSCILLFCPKFALLSKVCYYSTNKLMISHSFNCNLQIFFSLFDMFSNSYVFHTSPPIFSAEIQDESYKCYQFLITSQDSQLYIYNHEPMISSYRLHL